MNRIERLIESRSSAKTDVVTVKTQMVGGGQPGVTRAEDGESFIFQPSLYLLTGSSIMLGWALS